MTSFGKRAGIVVGQAATTAVPGAAKRRSNRWAERRQALISLLGSNHAHPCTVLDMSAGGARVEIQQATSSNKYLLSGLDSGVLLAIPIDRVEVPAEVRWRNGLQFGLRFTAPFNPTTRRHASSDLGTSQQQWIARSSGGRSSR